MKKWETKRKTLLSAFSSYSNAWSSAALQLLEKRARQKLQNDKTSVIIMMMITLTTLELIMLVIMMKTEFS